MHYNVAIDYKANNSVDRLSLSFSLFFRFLFGSNPYVTLRCQIMSVQFSFRPMPRVNEHSYAVRKKWLRPVAMYSPVLTRPLARHGSMPCPSLHHTLWVCVWMQTPTTDHVFLCIFC